MVMYEELKWTKTKVPGEHLKVELGTTVEQVLAAIKNYCEYIGRGGC